MRKLIHLKAITVLSAVAALVGSSMLLQAADQGTAKEERGQLSRKDYKFVREAAQGGGHAPDGHGQRGNNEGQHRQSTCHRR